MKDRRIIESNWHSIKWCDGVVTVRSWVEFLLIAVTAFVASTLTMYPLIRDTFDKECRYYHYSVDLEKGEQIRANWYLIGCYIDTAKLERK